MKFNLRTDKNQRTFKRVALSQFVIAISFAGALHATDNSSMNLTRKNAAAINNKNILVKEALRTSDILKTSAEAADIVVTGKVTDNKGEPLIGVSVKVKNTSIGAATDVSGNFSITIPSANADPILVVSYLGFVPQDIPVNKRTTINVQLLPNIKNLNEVVVVGYNVVRKSDVTGAVASVTAEEIRSRPVANALEAMQGKVAGVDITSNERPGQVGSVQIRGVRSLNANRGPLYVVDGITLSSGGIEAINPNDIESIDVLKDASATAIYGSRGANGVILITTKRGKSGRLSLDYTGTTTIEKLYDRTQMMNSAQYIEFRRDAYRRLTYLNENYPSSGFNYKNGYPDGPPTLAADRNIFTNDNYALANIEKGYQNGTWNGSLVPTTNWTKMVKKTGVTQNHTLSVSGGTDKIKAYGSFGYLSQGGTQLGQDFNRYNSKFSVDINPVKWFSMGGSVAATFSKQNYGFATSNATGPGTLYFAAQGMLPYAVPFDANGKRINLPGGDINILNPIGEDQYNINLRKTLRTLGSLYAQVNILPGLKYRLNFGPDFYNYNNGRYMDANSINRGGGEPGSTNYAQLNQTSNLTWVLDHLLYYNKTIGKHDFGVTLLQSSTSYRQEQSSMTATKLPLPKSLWYQLNSVSALDAFSSNLYETSLNSYMGRVNYGFNSKYLLTASARWDGASQLAPGHKWDFFPSAALAWRMEQEDFLKDVKWVDQLKLRVGFGSTGNAGVDAYTTEGRLATEYYTYGSSVQAGYLSSDPSAANPITYPDQNLGWEHTTQYNLGVDYSFIKGRIAGSLDVYTSKTTDLLQNAIIPSVTGFTRTLTNVGATANKGIELALTTSNIETRNFKWTSTLNFAANKERITSLPSGNDVPNLWFIGQRITVYYDYVKDGIWQDTPQDQAEMGKYQAANNDKRVFYPGDIKVKDLNGDYKIDANNDRKIVGHGSPNWTGGITNTFSYKNFDLSVFIFSRWGFTIPNIGAESLQGRFAQRVVNYWTPTNPTNDYPAPNYNSAAGDAFKSSMNYQDGSFIKIRNISLGYTLPKTVSQKLSLSNVRVYVQATNPGLIYSRVSWIDPDLGGSTYNRGAVLGLNVGF